MSALRDRRPARPEKDKEVQPEQMGNTVERTWRDISATDTPPPAESPWRTGTGPGSSVPAMPRLHSRWLCRTCLMPMVTPGARHSHIAEPFPRGQRTPGVHPDTTDGRARNTLDVTRYGR